MAESSSSKKMQTSNAAASGQTRHLGNESAWYVISTAPDYCKVGNAVVGFDSYSLLSKKSTASANVKSQLGSMPLYRVGDMARGVQANAGQGVCSQTSLGRGYVLFLDGQSNVKANGKMTGMDGAKCMINCNAAGVGNARAELRTEVKTVTSKPAQKPMLERMDDETRRVLREKWEGLKSATGTLWEALPGTSDEATTALARDKIADGVANSAKGIATLIGPSPDMVQGAYLSGDPAAIALVQNMQAQQQQAVGAIVNNVKKTWNEAEGRSGTAGAVSMVATTLGTEVLGGKGAGAAAKVATKAADLGKATTAAANVPSAVNGSRGSNAPSAAAPPSASATSGPAPSSGGGIPGSTTAVLPSGGRAGTLVETINGSSASPLEAAVRLDREIVQAKGAGWTPDEIKVLEQARKDKLAQNRSEAADAKRAARNGGVHVKRGRLSPNSSYELNGYRYTTDDKGRIATVEGDLRLEAADRDLYAQRTVGADDGRLLDDQGGHLIGSQFGGYGGRENLTPMGKEVNAYHTGEWGQMEKSWAERLKAGDSVRVHIEPVYNGATLRASSFNVTETINGKPKLKVILNPG